MRNPIPHLAALSLPLFALAPARGATLHRTWLNEVRAEAAKPGRFDPAPMDARAIAGLPDPVRRYFAACGFLGRPAMRNARLAWSEFDMRLGKGKGWTPVRVEQYNQVSEPARFVYLHARVGGIVPMNGRDKYQEGHGRMRIRLLGLFTIADARSAHMDQSARATYLAEVLLHPSAALMPWIRWEPIDSASARAVFTHGGGSVSGIFRFNAAGEFTSFETRDRWQDGHDEGPIPWSITASEYRDMGGYRLPTRMTAAWHEPQGDFEYFRGRLSGAEFNVEAP